MAFDKTHPFLATITDRRVLNKPGSQKCTVHLSLDISGSHFQYKVGDSIAVLAQNSPLLVGEILQAFGFDGTESICAPRTEEVMPLESFLTTKANLSKVTKKWVDCALFFAQDLKDKEILERLLLVENKDLLKQFCAERELWDFFKEIPSIKMEPQQLANHFAPLLPRFYSIASSQKATPNQIDLLIAHINYKTNEHLRHGVASHYLCEMAQMHTPSVPIYLHPSKEFTLPSDPSLPLIMIGPGTGIAPYRGFMQERLLEKDPGDHWLFFGSWNKENDFYYRDYLTDLEEKGLLKLSLAFSRDQPQKIYVQHKMLQEAPLFWKKIQEGAIVYVCGDASYMAKDVDKALHQIIEEQGEMTVEEAKEFVKQLRLEKRYLRDVY